MNCIFMKSVWEEIEKEYPDIEIKEYDADDDAEVHRRFAVKDIPTVILMDDDQNEIARLEGAKEKDELIRAINSKSG